MDIYIIIYVAIAGIQFILRNIVNIPDAQDMYGFP